MQKRTLPMYIFLNCITLGIYGFVVGRQMNEEINNLCNGDNQAPAVSYTAAVFIRLIPFFGPIYFNYWWYQQANRLKLNANRYGLNIKESGTDVFLMRTVLELPLIVVTALEITAALILPAVIWVLFGLLHPVIGYIFYIVSLVIFALFSGELTAGATISNYYMMKNLNRYADVYRNGSKPFDPMAYEYYFSAANSYPRFLPAIITGEGMAVKGSTGNKQIKPKHQGTLLGVKGSCVGYKFTLNAGEEIVIGKDAHVSSVVIDPAYKEISRKHVGVVYDGIRDQYCVVDYSSNGTWANGSKLILGQEVYLPHGTELKLANDKNIFRLV